jgi:hypothetical protein
MTEFHKEKLTNSIDLPLSLETRSIVQEYCYLATLNNLSEQQQERMVEILKVAEADSILDFWINEADHFIGHKLDLIDENSCKNQQARLREYLVTDYMEFTYISRQDTK